MTAEGPGSDGREQDLGAHGAGVGGVDGAGLAFIGATVATDGDVVWVALPSVQAPGGLAAPPAERRHTGPTPTGRGPTPDTATRYTVNTT
jgi:hypothetical protein